jgi:dTDP-4-amino-4,6-dideoxygalactose transaminase
LGARIDDRLVGTIGDAAIISFQATKVISSENGGALLTNNDLLAEKIKLIEDTAHQNRGWFRPFVTALARRIATSSLVYPVTQAGFQLLRNPQMYEIIKPAQEIPQGFLSTCSPFTSSLVLQQLNQLDINLTNRRRVAQIYIENLSQLSWLKIPSIPANCAPAWIQYPIIVEDKRGFYEFMQRKGIDISWTFRYSCADSYAGTDCMNSQKAAQSVIGLPTYPSLTNQQALQICEAAQKYRP